ncbi:MAG: response regulator transcription factor [Chloroflexota bacterium]
MSESNNTEQTVSAQKTRGEKTQENNIRVMIVEDHPLLIQGMRRIVESEDDMTIVAEATDGLQAVEKAIAVQPDIILMDINLPSQNGLQATSQIKNNAACEETAIIILTAYDDDGQFYHALRAGAAAYYPKDVRPSELLPGIRLVADGQYVIRGRVMNEQQSFMWLVNELRNMPIAGTVEEAEDRFSPLSPREMEILGYITRGASNKEIAYDLSIRAQTVKNHLSNMFRKLGVEDRTQAAVLALRRGWIRLEDTV